MHTSKFTKMYTLNIYDFLYTKYTSVNFKNKDAGNILFVFEPKEASTAPSTLSHCEGYRNMVIKHTLLSGSLDSNSTTYWLDDLGKLT